MAAAVAGVFAAIAVRLVLGSLEWPLVHDAPLMHYIAWRIGEGAVPYRDLFDMNFPGIYLIHLAVLRLLGDGDVAWRVFDLAWTALGAGVIAVFARRGAWPRRSAPPRRSSPPTWRAATGRPGSATSCCVRSWSRARRASRAGPKGRAAPPSGRRRGARRAMTIKPHALVFVLAFARSSR